MKIAHGRMFPRLLIRSIVRRNHTCKSKDKMPQGQNDPVTIPKESYVYLIGGPKNPTFQQTADKFAAWGLILCSLVFVVDSF